MSANEHLVEGREGLPKVSLVSADGARADVYLHGAHVTSWIPASGTERLFLSNRSYFRAGTAIRGGIPVIFPQFATEGPLPKHGFARTLPWDVVDVSSDTATLRLTASDVTRAIWPHEFVAQLRVRVTGSDLEVHLEVRNSGAEAFAFTSALHTYLRVDDVRIVSARGLAGNTYRDSAAGGLRRVDTSSTIEIRGEVDRVYLDATSPVDVVEPARSARVSMTGFSDVVVWNPGAKLAASLTDMDADGYLNMLCIEAASVGRPIELAPGARWSGMQRISAR